jgi:CheY-like chemotaxis protein
MVEVLAARHIENELQVLPDGQQATALVGVIAKTQGVPCPDIMLLDMNLPKTDGAAVLAAFRENGSCAATPVIGCHPRTAPGTAADSPRSA